MGLDGWQCTGILFVLIVRWGANARPLPMGRGPECANQTASTRPRLSHGRPFRRAAGTLTSLPHLAVLP
jgi:hypothetical protein